MVIPICVVLVFILVQMQQTRGFRLLLIRHAQSQNNVIAKQMTIKYAGQSSALMRKEFEQLRSFEPSLSEVGSIQAEALRDYMVNAFKGLIGQPVPVYCSHMQRTLLTSKPFLNAMGWKGYIKDDLFEVGGSFETKDGIDTAHAGKNKEFYQEFFPEYQLSSEFSNRDTGWYLGSSRETKNEANKRADGIVNWLWEQVSLHQSMEGSYQDKDVDLCLVIHGDLLGMIVRRLMSTTSETHFLHLNTAQSLFDLQIKGNDNGTRVVSALYLNRVDHLLGKEDSDKFITGDEMMRVIA